MRWSRVLNGITWDEEQRVLGIPGEEFSGDERSDESCGEDRRLSSGRYGL